MICREQIAPSRQLLTADLTRAGASSRAAQFQERPMLRSRLLMLNVLMFTAGCSATDRTAPPADSQKPVVESQTIVAATPTEISGLPGEVAPYAPGVSVIVMPGLKPVPGVKVVFTFSDGRSSYSTVTDASGRAALNELHFDSRGGQYDVVATAGDVGSVSFHVVTLDVKVIATYDLRAVGGVKGPPFYTGMGFSGLTGAHYQLFDNGTYRFGYEWNGHTSWNWTESYRETGPGLIEFYLDQATAPASTFYASRNYLFSTGTLSGGVMTVRYEDPVDFEDEEYVLAGSN
jgi:hypothetical protein